MGSPAPHGRDTLRGRARRPATAAVAHRFHYWRPCDTVERHSGLDPSFINGDNRLDSEPSMAKKRSSKKKSSAAAGPENRPIADNRKARHRFDVLDTLECGIALVGSEVKSLRNGKISLDEAYGRIRDGEFWLIGCDIPEYTQATVWNHAPKRPRKLLVHRREFGNSRARPMKRG